MQTALGLESYRLKHQGQLPPDLSSLTPELSKEVTLDPFDGQPLRYKRLPKGYMIYSIGPDGNDDGGLERASSRGSDANTPYDIPFKVMR